MQISFEDFVCRAPVKFVGAIMDRATVVTVRCRATTQGGKSGEKIL